MKNEHQNWALRKNFEFYDKIGAFSFWTPFRLIAYV